MSLAVLLAVMCKTSWGQPKIYALVIGIDDYTVENRLQGAVADAQDISQALQKLRAQQVEVLLNQQASKARIRNTWQALVQKSKPGDTLIFTFSGHGAQIVELNSGEERDQKDEILVLANYNHQHKTIEHDAIVDNEWRQWLSQVKADRTVITLFDACHSGTLTRSAQTATPMTYRGLTPMNQKARRPLNFPTDEVAVGQLPNEVYIGGTTDDQLVPEITLNGQQRGALSYYFADALRGGADSNGDKQLSIGELRAHLVRQVPVATNDSQHPEVHFTQAKSVDEILFRTNTYQASYPLENALRVYVDNDVNWKPQLVNSSQQHVQFVTRSPWDLRLDRRQHLHNQQGQTVAQLKSRESVQSALQKWQVIQHLEVQAIGEPLIVELLPDFNGEPGLPSNDWFQQGEKVWVRVSKAPQHDQFMLFNLASDGLLQIILEPTSLQSTIWQYDTTVNPPYGADHLFAVAWDGQSGDAKDILQLANKPLKSAQHLLALLQGLRRVKLGTVSFYTKAAN